MFGKIKTKNLYLCKVATVKKELVYSPMFKEPFFDNNYYNIYLIFAIKVENKYIDIFTGTVYKLKGCSINDGHIYVIDEVASNFTQAYIKKSLLQKVLNELRALNSSENKDIEENQNSKKNLIYEKERRFNNVK